jgi:hypothetical protein
MTHTGLQLSGLAVLIQRQVVGLWAHGEPYGAGGILGLPLLPFASSLQPPRRSQRDPSGSPTLPSIGPHT